MLCCTVVSEWLHCCVSDYVLCCTVVSEWLHCCVSDYVCCVVLHCGVRMAALHHSVCHSIRPLLKVSPLCPLASLLFPHYLPHPTHLPFFLFLFVCLLNELDIAHVCGLHFTCEVNSYVSHLDLHTGSKHFILQRL